MREAAIKGLFLQGPSTTTRLVLLMLLSVALMTYDHRRDDLATMRGALAMAVYPIQRAVTLPADISHWLGETFASRQRLMEDNASLRAQHLLLQAKLQRLAALEVENRRLRAMLDSTFNMGERFLIAERVSTALDPYREQILLNKSSGDGVYQGQPVLDARGVMGQIIHVSPVNATALLITDPSHAIPVQVNRNGLQTVAMGSGGNRLILPHVANDADVQVGDLLVTSGLGGRFPPGYPVAQITDIRRAPRALFAEVTASPTAHLHRAREVLLVWPNGLEEEVQTAEPAATDDPAPEAPAAS